MRFLILTSTLLLVMCAGCTQPVPSNQEDPVWVREMIAQFQREPVTNPPRTLWKSEFKGTTVYYIPPICCDQFGLLYDATGRVICAPDGGITGRGDGRCPEYADDHRNDKLVWKDTRTR